MTIQFNIEEAPETAAREIDQLLYQYNLDQLKIPGKPNCIEKNYLIKHEDKIIAGIVSYILPWKVLTTDILFVSEHYRGKGLGSALLKKVEHEAMALDVTLSHLDTFDFQAKDFYIKHGYEIFGVLDGCPHGHQRFYLKKNLIRDRYDSQS